MRFNKVLKRMSEKEFILQRICVYAGREIDPNVDSEVEQMLRSKFNIHLPQRRSMNESLAATISDHEVLGLLIKYRTSTT
jgi:hypothetical protein